MKKITSKRIAVEEQQSTDTIKWVFEMLGWSDRV